MDQGTLALMSGTLKDVYEGLRNHPDPMSGGCERAEDNLLRLFRKNVNGFITQPFEEAHAKGRLAITEEQWPLARIQKLPSGFVESEPYRDDTAVIVLIVNGYEFLIDGHKRRNKWINEGRDTCPVLCVRV